MGAKLTGRARQLAQMHQKPKPVDFDPEVYHAPSENEEDDNSSDDNAGTEHYASVGKSKLRKNESLTLGPQYSGARVSRSALEDESDGLPSEDDENEDGEEFDDPDTADIDRDAARITEDEVIDSDDAFVDSDAKFTEKFTFRGSSKPKSLKTRKVKPKASDFMSETEDEEGFEDAKEEVEDEEEGSTMHIDDKLSEESEEGNEDEEDDEDEEDEEDEEDVDLDDKTLAVQDLSGGSDKEDEEDENENENVNWNFKANDHLAALSEASKQEVLKGQAVRDQRKLFDGLLNFRIRLQKALVSVNTFPIADKETTVDSSEEEAAEEAAISLWNTLDNIRSGLTNSAYKGAQKRKHQVDRSTATETIWGYLQEDETEALKHRRITLDKWSKRVGPSAATTRNRLDRSVNSICTLLDDQLSDPSRLIKRTQVPRSCAPAHTAKKITEDEYVYDDADFYQILLKELVDQRTTETDQSAGTAVATVRWMAMKEAKTRKMVDRKASRGRKLKFTVHEKLQSFMAPEDRRQWEEDAIDRLFSTLLGQRVALDEDEEPSEEDEEMDAEEEGLRLFCS